MTHRTKQEIASRLEEMDNIAATILSDFPQCRVFALFGKMGVGKTTLIKAFCQVLKVRETVNSPTFSLINEYSTETGETVFHFDFYRIKKLEEVYDIGYEEYIYSGHRCFMEWPEKIRELLPESYVYITVEENKNHERIVSWVLKE